MVDKRIKDSINPAMINELKSKVEEFKRRGYDEEDLKITVDGNRVWFTGELSYNTHEKLANELDKIVAKYDKDAYFDAQTSGRWVAHFFDSKVKDSVIPNSAKTLEVTLKRDISNSKAGDKVILKRNERGEWSDGKYIYPVNLLRTPEICEVKVVDNKTFTVKYKDRKFRVKAEDHQDAARKVINKSKDASTLSKQEYRNVKNSIPRFNNIKVDFEDFSGKGLEATINWSAVGDVSVREAKTFLKDLQQAIKTAEDLERNYGGYEIDWKN